MEKNIELAQRIADHIAEHPQDLMMSVWGQRSEGDCGTSACFAGWALVETDQAAWVEGEGLFVDSATGVVVEKPCLVMRAVGHEDTDYRRNWRIDPETDRFAYDEDGNYIREGMDSWIAEIARVDLGLTPSEAGRIFYSHNTTLHEAIAEVYGDAVTWTAPPVRDPHEFYEEDEE